MLKHLCSKVANEEYNIINKSTHYLMHNKIKCILMPHIQHGIRDIKYIVYSLMLLI